MKVVPSEIPFSYRTIQVTRSRIDKGLLAIPQSISSYFPKRKAQVRVFFGTNDRAVFRNYTPIESSSRECRIGGMKDFFEKNRVRDRDELVIQFLEENQYRIFTESQFQQSIASVEKALDESKDEKEASRQIDNLSQITNTNTKEVALSEYNRLSLKSLKERKRISKGSAKTPERIAPSIRKLLVETYGGKCQVTGFGFLTKRGEPYFEVHHLRPEIGDHLKNLLVVCPNIHAQFTHAKVRETFDPGGWLRWVAFNEQKYPVFQIIDQLSEFKKEIHGE